MVFMEKKMVINTATCDVRKVTEETLEAYGQIVINAAVVLADERSRTLLAKYPVTMNCAHVLDVQGDIQVSTVNGSAQIKSTDAPAGKRYLIINGSVQIGPDTQKVLEQYVGILVNGSVTYPESLSGCLGMMTVNGIATCYPDGAVVLKRNAVIDKLFALRAKEALYWSAKRMIMVDSQLDPAALEAKGARFASKEAVIAESKVEGLVGLIDENTDIRIVPDGTAVILDDVKLDDTTVKKYGKKLYIIGDLTVDKESAGALEQLEYLNIRGDASVTKDLKALLMENADEISGEILIRKGRHINDRVSVRISKWMLERETEGISVSDCATVKIDEDVGKELILDRLDIFDCASVKCSAQQEDAVAAVCRGVAKIGEDTGGVGDMIKDAMGMESGQGGLLGTAKELLNTKVINAAEYVM